MKLNQKGAVPILILVAAIGLVVFSLVTATASFKDGLFASLYPKKSIFASEPIGDSTPPTVSIIKPKNGALVSGTVTVVAIASDNVAVSKVEFYVGSNLVCTDTSSYYTCSRNVPDKKGVSYTITAKAYDISGNYAKSVISVTSK